MKNVVISFCLLLFLSSCYQDALVQPESKNSTLLIGVVDERNKPVPNATIEVKYDLYSKPIVYDSASAKGEFFTQLLEGKYIIKVRCIRDNREYASVKTIQIVYGINSTVRINPFQR